MILLFFGAFFKLYLHMTRYLDRIIVVMIMMAGVDSPEELFFSAVSFIFLENILKRVLLLFVIVAPLIKERNQKFPQTRPS